MNAHATQTEPTAPPAAAGGPALNPLREFRLAIVMYGGVSLSIYMNGVGQELFHLVRSTAPSVPQGGNAVPESQLVGSEKAYRRLAQVLGDTPKDPMLVDPQDPVLATFVIDVLTGSSAGGINSVFLAKALANDQEMAGLTNLWLDQGDIEKLLNDRGSKVENVAPEKPPQSLLNSQRMYVDLLDAFDRMEAKNPSGAQDPRIRSPFVDELDLFVTTTDLNGLELPIRFDNGVTVEPRYRNVFHLRYDANAIADPTSASPARNDFVRDNNPFLAFACRCTSAFPLAFKPMVLRDIDALVGAVPGYERLRADREEWQRFYPDYLPSPLGPAPGSIGFVDRPFADGGALDNKPFSYAIDTLTRRRSTVPANRKLIFVEPDPDTRVVAREHEGRPNALQNFLAQSALIPRQETVRDDLRRIDDLNRLIRRTDAVLDAIEIGMSIPSAADHDADTVATGGVAPIERAAATAPTVRRSTASTLDRTLEDEIVARGVGYPGYRSLRVVSTHEELSAYLALLARVPEESDYMVALRALCRAWFERRYDGDRAPGRPDSQRFLKDFDLAYRRRRLAFLERRLDRLYPLNEAARELLSSVGLSYWPGDAEQGRFRLAIQGFKVGVKHALIALEGGDQRMPAGGTDAMIALVPGTGITMTELDTIVRHRSDEGRKNEAIAVVDRHLAGIDRLMQAIRDRRAAATQAASDVIDASLRDVFAMGFDGARQLADFVASSYNNFDHYDAAAFPLQYGSQTGEADNVEVIRISPLDAHSLKPTRGDGAKVTGGRFQHFGAFLDRLWRENDIMWGRLDAAEVLIEALVPLPDDPTDREARDHRQACVAQLRDQAHCEILREELKREDLAGLLEVGKNAEKLGPLNPQLQALLQTAGRCEGLLDHFRDNYARPTELEPRAALKSIGRGAHIMGQLFRQIALDRGVVKASWLFSVVSRLGQALTGLVEAAVPGSLMHLLFFHWFIVLYLFELLAVVGGAVFGSRAIAQFGTTALLITTTVNIVIWLIARAIHVEHRWKSPFLVLGAVLLGVLVIGTVILAYVGLRHLGQQHDWIPFVGRS
jgi:patatin-related protein